MQNENHTPATPPKDFLVPLITGVLLLAVAALCSQQAKLPALTRSSFGDLLMLMHPVLLALGAVTLLLGLFRFIRRFEKVSSMISPYQATRFEKAWRVIIWVVAGATVFPGWWLDLLTRLSGGRPGNEGVGLGGTMMMLIIGLPSLVLAIFNELRLRRNRGKKK